MEEKIEICWEFIFAYHYLGIFHLIFMGVCVCVLLFFCPPKKTLFCILFYRPSAHHKGLHLAKIHRVCRKNRKNMAIFFCLYALVRLWLPFLNFKSSLLAM